MTVSQKRLYYILLPTTLLLLVPFIAMQFTSEVSWSPFDFLVMGALLLGAGFGIEFFVKKVKKRNHRIGIVLAVLLVFMLVWAELAVGILGTPFAGN